MVGFVFVHMAYWIQKTSGKQNMMNYRYFICDYISDIKKLPKFGIEGEKQEDDTISSLPCSYGSVCLCLEDSSKWILSKATNEWKSVNISGGNSGSSSGSSGDINPKDIATDTEVDEVLDSIFQ